MTRSGVSLDYKVWFTYNNTTCIKLTSSQDIAFPPGRNANGFKQKINALKNSLKSEWEVGPGGQAASDDTAKSTPKTTPRKRKNKDSAANGDADGSPKKRGRPKKKVSEPEGDDAEEQVVKEEIKDEHDVMEDDI